MSVDYTNAASALRISFGEFMANALPDVQVAYENQAFDPPEGTPAGSYGGDPGQEYVGTWVRFSIQWGEAKQADISRQPRVRTTGVAFTQVFVPAGSGSGIAEAISNEVAGFFRRLRLDGMTFRAPHPRPVTGRDGAWYQLNVIAPFHYDAIQEG